MSKDEIGNYLNQFSSAGRTLIVVAAFVVVAAGMQAATPIIAPLLVSVFIVAISAPPMFWLQHRGLPQWAAMVAVIVGLSLLGVLLLVLVGNSVADLLQRLPEYQQRLAEYFDGTLGWLAGHGVQVSRDMIAEMVDPGKLLAVFTSTLSGLGGVLANGLLIFFAVVFMLLEVRGFPAKLKAMLSNPGESYPRFQHFADSLHRYLAIKAGISLVTALLVTIPVALMGLDYPLLWGVTMFLLNYVPNIGPIIAAVPAVLLALVQLGPAQALAVAGIYLAANTLMGNIVEPRYLGRGVGLSTLVVFASLVFWGWILGPIGMLLSVPLTMAAKIAMDGSDETRWLAVLLGPGVQEGDRTAHTKAS